MKKEDSLKPYDAKKSVWVPNKEDGGYDEGLIQEIDGDKATVKVGWETKNFKADQLQQVQTPRKDHDLPLSIKITLKMSGFFER